MYIFKICYPCLVISFRADNSTNSNSLSIIFFTSEKIESDASNILPITTNNYPKERKKERKNGKKKETVDFSWARFFRQPWSTEHTICWHSRANGTWQNKLRLPPTSGMLAKKKTLVFAPSSPILPLVKRLYVLCTKMNFCFTRNILGIINLLWIPISNNLRILDNSTKREKIQSLNNNL